MVAPHGVEAIVERAAVEPAKGGVLLVVAICGEVALDDHRRGIDRGDLGDRGRVHHLGIGRFARLGAEHGFGPERLVDAAHLFAEMDVVDGGEAAEQLAVGPWQGAHLDAQKRVLGVGREPVEAVDLAALMEYHFVVGDRRELQRQDGYLAMGYHGRSRRAATGRAHQRPEKRHAGVGSSTTTLVGAAGGGQVISIAATIAAISSSVGVGWMSPIFGDGAAAVTAACSRACVAGAPRAWSAACAGRR